MKNNTKNKARNPITAILFAAIMIASVFSVAMLTNVGATSTSLLFTYTGDVLPSADGWSIINYPAYESIGAHVEDGVLHFIDPYTYLGSAISYIREWPVSPDYINVAEFDVKGVSCSLHGGIYIGTSDDNYNMLYTIYPDRIQSTYDDYHSGELHLGEIYYFDTTSQYNTYKAVIDNGTAKLYINGELVLEQRAGIGTYHDVNGVEFGVGNSYSIGEAYFDEIRAYTIPKIIQVTIDIDPDTLNLKSNGEWLTAHIELPEGYDVNDIAVSTIYLLDDIPVDTIAPATVGDYDSDGISDLMVKIDRTAVVAKLGTEDLTEGETGTDYYEELTLTGELTDGTLFEGSDTIRVIDKGKGK